MYTRYYIYLPVASGIGILHFSFGIECGVNVGSGFVSCCLIKPSIFVGENLVQSPTLGNSRANINPLDSSSIGHFQEYQLDTPTIVSTIFPTFLFGSICATDVPQILFLMAFSISSPVSTSFPKLTNLLIACEIYSNINVIIDNESLKINKLVSNSIGSLIKWIHQLANILLTKQVISQTITN